MATWAAIFDWDGVVLDSARHHERSWELMAREEGFSLPADHFKRGYGMKNETIISRLFGWTTDPARIARMSTRKEELYRQLIHQEGIVVLPGVSELVQALDAAAVPCAVGSSTPRLNITCLLDQLAFGPRFAAIITAEDVAHGKPDPEVFVKAAKQLEIPAERCVVFEDTPVGIQAAHRAGMRVVAVTTTHAAEALRDADRVVERLTDIVVADLHAWFDHVPTRNVR